MSSFALLEKFALGVQTNVSGQKRTNIGYVREIVEIFVLHGVRGVEKVAALVGAVLRRLAVGVPFVMDSHQICTGRGSEVGLQG